MGHHGGTRELGPQDGSFSRLGPVMQPLSGAGDHERNCLVLSERAGEFNTPDSHLGASTCRGRRISLLLFHNFKPNFLKKCHSHGTHLISLWGSSFWWRVRFVTMKLLSHGDCGAWAAALFLFLFPVIPTAGSARI